MENYIRQCGLEHSLLELVKTRVSQINGCAYCLDMHTKDARAAGETEQRLYLLAAWRESTFYSERKRAALAWAEAVTQLSGHEVPDELYAQVQRQFDEKALVDLTLAIIAMTDRCGPHPSFDSKIDPAMMGRSSRFTCGCYSCLAPASGLAHACPVIETIPPRPLCVLAFKVPRAA